MNWYRQRNINLAVGKKTNSKSGFLKHLSLIMNFLHGQQTAVVLFRIVLSGKDVLANG